MKFTTISIIFDDEGVLILAGDEAGHAIAHLPLTREAADSLWREIANELEGEDHRLPVLRVHSGIMAQVLSFPLPQVPSLPLWQAALEKTRRAAHYRALASEAAGCSSHSVYDQDA